MRNHFALHMDDDDDVYIYVWKISVVDDICSVNAFLFERREREERKRDEWKKKKKYITKWALLYLSYAVQEPHSTCPFRSNGRIFVCSTKSRVLQKQNDVAAAAEWESKEKKLPWLGNKCTSSNFIIRLSSSSCTKAINQVVRVRIEFILSFFSRVGRV